MKLNHLHPSRNEAVCLVLLMVYILLTALVCIYWASSRWGV